MRTIAAGWALPQRNSGGWLSDLRAKLRHSGRRTAAREAHPFVQADAAAFANAFMRI